MIESRWIGLFAIVVFAAALAILLIASPPESSADVSPYSFPADCCDDTCAESLCQMAVDHIYEVCDAEVLVNSQPLTKAEAESYCQDPDRFECMSARTLLASGLTLVCVDGQMEPVQDALDRPPYEVCVQIRMDMGNFCDVEVTEGRYEKDDDEDDDEKSGCGG